MEKSRLLFIPSLLFAMCSPSVYSQGYVEARRFDAPYATQAVAVDKSAFYAIDNNHITKYSQSGDSITTWHEPDKEVIRHFNSGIVYKGKLYCAHSNFPEVPMASSIEIFDAKTLEHAETVSLGIEYGSCTWVLPAADGGWYVFFAHYDKSGANAGGQMARDVSWSQLVKFDSQWRRERGWILPKALVEEVRPTSISGAILVGDVFYMTGHDAKKCYLVRIPDKGMRLEWFDTIDVPFPGQGIAMDDAGNLWGIDRKKRQVIKAVKQ